MLTGSARFVRAWPSSASWPCSPRAKSTGRVGARAGARGQIIASEGTLYPLLARLRRNGLVETSWRESNSGPPRRYYHLTSDGELALASFKKQWRVFRDAVDEILNEGTQE